MRHRENIFDARFQEVAQVQGWSRPPLPAAALAMWEGFVTECRIGYEFDLSEYLNDLSVRDLLAAALADVEIGRMGECEWLARETHRIDSLFRGLLANGPVVRVDCNKWWNRSLPGYGAEEFVSDVQERRGVSLRIVDRM
ncbi:hypothetical protein ACF07T_33700 [Streptomyces sp. NPDC015184]|uniref:hypothetical protein n=1 Tax=Streptomyces sp. NPDC015184 TaxID=3364946 RepID=UPI0037018158